MTITAPDSSDTTDAAPTAGWTTVSTPDGPFTVVVNDSGTVLASGWTSEPEYLLQLVHRDLRPADIGRSAGLSAIGEVVDAYYAGEHDAPQSVPVFQHGGPFLEKSWTALRTVRAGAPVTYSDLAGLAGEPAAIRAAATSCARNAAALFVPCHRVLRRDGKLGGFRYGVELKQRLIDREATTPTN
ncbi:MULTISPECIES: methylated-DNA--[protein]-cysteine S-methyltransferase [unclassified Gordonia (in: high G+C Gram-positive bacteria)]|jgi:methylated-DNA-[protein]-cysteine S-methyltransferase